jgi:hypothetical protein
MDPSVLLKSTWRAQWPDPVEDRKKLLTLRDLMDQRRIREQQYQLHQMEMQAKQRDIDEYNRFNQALSTLPDNASLRQVVSAGGSKYGIPYYTQQRQAQTAATQQEEAALKLKKERDQSLANQMAAIRLLPPEQQQDAWDKLYGGVPVDRPPSDADVQAQIAVGYGPKEQQAMQASREEAARKKSQDELALSDKQLDYAIKTIPDNPAEWPAWRGSLPEQTRALIPAEYSWKARQRALQLGLTAQQRSQQQPNTAGDWIRIAVDPNATPEDQAQADKALSKFATQGRANAPQMILSADQRVGNEAKLRDDYRQESKNYLTIRDAYGKIQGAAQSQTGPGDISLIYGYMKILDPGSTVREGEFATAQNAGSIPQRVQAMYNKAINGERLDPTIRNQFVEEAAKIYRQTEANQDKIRNTYGGIATRSNLDPQNVVVDYSPGVVAPRAPAAKQPPAQQTGPAPVVPLGDVLLQGQVEVKDPNGKSHYFANKAQADAFRKRARIP